MARLIDADEIKLPRGFFEKVDNVPKFYEWLGTLPTVDAEPTEEQVKEYCRKRCLVVVDSELLTEMKAMWSSVPVVRCKDCKWRGDIGCAVTVVDESDKPTDDDFCSWGERREER